MKTIKVYHYDAFSSIPHMGNPAGVVLDVVNLNEEQMIEVAEKVGFSETAFLFPSGKADFQIRYFTPGQEVDLCGHATMATVYAMKTKGLLGDKTELVIETKAGLIPVRLNSTAKGDWTISMGQASPQFQEFHGSFVDLAAALGIDGEEMDPQLPTLYGSTGAWTLLVPIKTLDACARMKPVNQLFPSILKEKPRASIHPFCLETYDPKAHMHGRHFSSPFSGTIEDPVTGTASGVMGAYFARYIKKEPDGSFNLMIEQGQEIGRDGKIMVTVTNNGEGIEITGNAVFVKEFDVFISA